MARPPGRGYRVDPPRDAAQPLSSGALLESSRPGAIHRASLCRRHRIVQQADGAGSHPSCLSRRLVGTVGKQHRRRRPRARSAAASADLQHRGLPGNASLSAARGQRTRARRAAEGGAAKVIAHRPPIRALTIWLIVTGDAETHSAATAPNLSKHRTNRVPLAAAHPRIASQFVNSRARYAQLG